VPPEAAFAGFEKLSKEKNPNTLLTANRTRAIDCLADWALSPPEQGTPFCAVLGEVGIGKTTTLMMLARELEDRREVDPTIPAVIFIDLKDCYFEGEPDWETILGEVIKRHWKGEGGRALTPQSHPEIRGRYADKSAEVLNQDFRTATLCLLPDGERDGFRFAHSSLYEYFLALHLAHQLEQRRLDAWDFPLPSDETLEFFGQLLAEGEKVDAATIIEQWTHLLECETASPAARRTAFRAWLLARENTWPEPMPRRAQLHGLDLERWQIGSGDGPLLDLREASLVGACLDHAVLRRVLLDGADALGASARLAEFDQVSLVRSRWEGAQLVGGNWRDCDATGLLAESANWHDCNVVKYDFTLAALPADWSCEAALPLPDLPKHFNLVLRHGHIAAVMEVS
jgi:hypothetical protein